VLSAGVRLNARKPIKKSLFYGSFDSPLFFGENICIFGVPVCTLLIVDKLVLKLL
jgi:hypothetical protein